MRKLKKLNVLSGMAIIQVVLIHTNGFYVKAVLKSNHLNVGLLVNMPDNLIWAAVPIFIFIAGQKWYLNNKSEEIKVVL